jgi:hypothetical protein
VVILLAVVPSLLVAAVCNAGEQAWERLGARDGIVIDRRGTADPSIREMRSPRGRGPAGHHHGDALAA